MNDRIPDLDLAIDLIVQQIQRLLIDRDTPILIALDGGSGSGKSTLALLVAQALAAAVVHGDDFFAADITDAEWETRTPEARAASVIDWQRLRFEALEPLLAGVPAQWHTFDFTAGKLSDGTYTMRTDFVKCEPKAVIVLDGAYAMHHELTDLINYSVLLNVPVEVRHERLTAREDKVFLADWHARWDDVEHSYFTYLRPESFDLVVTNQTIR